MTAKEKVLVPVDFSWVSEPLVRQALRWLGPGGGELILLHVCVYCAQTAGSPLADFPLREADDRLESLAKAARGWAGPAVQVRTIMRPGLQPDAVILETAKEENVSMIIAGTHSRRGWELFVMGSVAHALLKSATCPILIFCPERRAARRKQSKKEMVG